MYCSIIYWMSGLSVDVGDFFYYLAITLSADTALAAFYRFCVFFSPSLVIAEVLWSIHRIIEHLLHSRMLSPIVFEVDFLYLVCE
jgi:hypothetical protein